MAIESAFEDVQREDGVTLHQAVAMDNRFSEEAQAEARKLDTDTHWQDIADELLLKTEPVFPFFDSKGLRYYLPAYMRFILKHPGHIAGDMIIYSLVPGPSSKWSVESLVKNLDLNGNQCKVIFDFLKTCEHEFNREKPEWKGALTEWEKFSKNFL